MKQIAVKLALYMLSVLEKVARARLFVIRITGNSYFPSPNPAMAAVSTAANNLEAAALLAKDGGRAARANMRAKEAILDSLLKTLGAYVESIANADLSNAQTIVLSAGMDFHRYGRRSKDELEVRTTGKPGELRITHRAVKNCTYEFQMTLDPSNEASYKRIYAGTRGTFVVRGLTSGTCPSFRGCVITADGVGPWTDVKSAYVL
jgi:hypothetical protein